MAPITPPKVTNPVRTENQSLAESERTKAINVLYDKSSDSDNKMRSTVNMNAAFMVLSVLIVPLST
jgi:hypothetical protein